MTQIEIFGDIDNDMVARVRSELAKPVSDIHLIIESPGGEFDAAVEIYSALLAHPARITAFIGQASSGALLVAMAADRRIALPDAQILLHRSKLATGQPADAASGRMLALCDREVALILCDRTGTQAAVFLAEMKSEDDAPLEWCLANNIIQEIV